MERVQELKERYHDVYYRVVRTSDNTVVTCIDNFGEAACFMSEYHKEYNCDVVLVKIEQSLDGAMLVPEEPEVSYADMISRLKDIKSLLDILLEEEE